MKTVYSLTAYERFLLQIFVFYNTTGE